MTPFQQKMLDACDKNAKGICPSWWVCAKRGCYQDALANYADYKGKRESYDLQKDYYVGSDGVVRYKDDHYSQGLRWKGER